MKRGTAVQSPPVRIIVLNPWPLCDLLSLFFKERSAQMMISLRVFKKCAERSIEKRDPPYLENLKVYLNDSNILCSGGKFPIHFNEVAWPLSQLDLVSIFLFNFY